MCESESDINCNKKYNSRRKKMTSPSAAYYSNFIWTHCWFYIDGVRCDEICPFCKTAERFIVTASAIGGPYGSPLIQSYPQQQFCAKCIPARIMCCKSCAEELLKNYYNAVRVIKPLNANKPRPSLDVQSYTSQRIEYVNAKLQKSYEILDAFLPKEVINLVLDLHGTAQENC